MTYTQAKLIIWNADSYSATKVHAAVVYILGSINASAEDIAQASSLI